MKQPIETAPRDREILLYGEIYSYDGPEAEPTWCTGRFDLWRGEAWRITVGGIWCYSGIGVEATPLFVRATHWMELPS